MNNTALSLDNCPHGHIYAYCSQCVADRLDETNPENAQTRADTLAKDLKRVQVERNDLATELAQSLETQLAQSAEIDRLRRALANEQARNAAKSRRRFLGR